MRRTLACLLTAAAVTAVGTAAAAATPTLATPTGLAAVVADRSVRLTWQPASFPGGVRSEALEVQRDGVLLARLGATATTYDDQTVTTGTGHTYAIRTTAAKGTRSL